jgi:hypothetical protein
MSSRRDSEGFPEPPFLNSLHSLFLKNNRNILEEMPIKDVSLMFKNQLKLTGNFE